MFCGVFLQRLTPGIQMSNRSCCDLLLFPHGHGAHPFSNCKGEDIVWDSQDLQHKSWAFLMTLTRAILVILRLKRWLAVLFKNFQSSFFFVSAVLHHALHLLCSTACLTPDTCMIVCCLFAFTQAALHLRTSSSNKMASTIYTLVIHILLLTLVKEKTDHILLTLVKNTWATWC